MIEYKYGKYPKIYQNSEPRARANGIRKFEDWGGDLNSYPHTRSLRTIPMNLNVDCSHSDPLLSAVTIPLLVAVREWGTEENAAYAQTELLMIIVEGVQAAAERKVRCK